jgi:hypothetical protein
MWTIVPISSQQISGANSLVGFVQIEQCSSEFVESSIIGNDNAKTTVQRDAQF